MEKIFLDQEFSKFWRKIENKENFTLLRYGDGERAIMCGEVVKAQEGWKSPAYVSELGEALLDTLSINENNFYYGISCPCCDQKAYYWYSTRIRNKNITFANLWINKNYNHFYKLFNELKRDAVLIANYRAKGHAIGNLNILKYYEVGDDCISFWKEKGKLLIEEIKKEFGYRNDLLYVVAAGPMSEPIIVDLYKNNPNNCYIDFGSSIDMFVHEKITRPYMKSGTKYANSNCWMYDPQKINFDVSVVLTLYKRPGNLLPQIESIENQSLKPREILLYQDGTGDTITIPDNVRNKLNFIEIGKENKGVWERFRFADRKANSEYVCLFDDDTIPGSRWLENCHAEMMEEEGLYGAIGIIVKNKKYVDGMFYRVGWNKNTYERTKVDFVGHSWFLRKKWLSYLFDGTEELQQFKQCAEDMSLSFKLQEHGISTYVPPQPKKKKEFNGSLFGKKLGGDSHSLFKKNGWKSMSQAFDLLINKYHFKTLQELNADLYNSIVYKYRNSFLYAEKFADKKCIYFLGIKFYVPRGGLGSVIKNLIRGKGV